MKVTMLFTAAIIIGFGSIGCQNSPKRPSNVPAKAISISIPHGYDWDYCWVDKAMNVNKCQIFNRGGDLLYDGVFLRYEGTGVVPEESLKITQHGGEQWIELQNGVILIPESNYTGIKKTLDWLNGKRSHP